MKLNVFLSQQPRNQAINPETSKNEAQSAESWCSMRQWHKAQGWSTATASSLTNLNGKLLPLY